MDESHPIYAVCFACSAYADDVLPSWNETAPKKAIVAFVERIGDIVPRAPFFGADICHRGRTRHQEKR